MRQGLPGLFLTPNALFEKRFGTPMLRDEVAVGRSLAALAGSHGLYGFKLFIVCALAFIYPPDIHQEIKVVIKGQVELADV